MPLLRASHQSYPLIGRFQDREWVPNGACPKHLMGCLRNSHNDSKRGEMRLTLHLVPFCRTCGITESWAAPAWWNYNNASDVKPRNVPARSGVAKAKERHLISFNATCEKSQMFQSTLLSSSHDTLCAVALSSSI